MRQLLAPVVRQHADLADAERRVHAARARNIVAGRSILGGGLADAVRLAGIFASTAGGANVARTRLINLTDHQRRAFHLDRIASEPLVDVALLLCRVAGGADLEMRRVGAKALVAPEVHSTWTRAIEGAR